MLILKDHARFGYTNGSSEKINRTLLFLNRIEQNRTVSEHFYSVRIEEF
jgi:hypothetical protein